MPAPRTTKLYDLQDTDHGRRSRQWPRAAAHEVLLRMLTDRGREYCRPLSFGKLELAKASDKEAL
jgi:hypothetical protein